MDVQCAVGSIAPHTVSNAPITSYVAALEWIVTYPQCFRCAWACRTQIIDLYRLNPTMGNFLHALFAHMAYFDMDWHLVGDEGYPDGFAVDRKVFPNVDLPDFANGKLTRFHSTSIGMLFYFPGF
jgi:hypothetical protein